MSDLGIVHNFGSTFRKRDSECGGRDFAHSGVPSGISGQGLRAIWIGNAVPCPPAVTAVADIAAGFVALAGHRCRLDGGGVKIVHLVPVGAGGGMTRQTIVPEQILDLGPRAGQTHDLLRAPSGRGT